MSRALDPEHPIDDAFLDAVLGLDSLCRALGLTLDDAIQPGDASLARAPDDLVDALLGLISLRTTVALVVAAASSASASAAAVADAAESVAGAVVGSPEWSREQLR